MVVLARGNNGGGGGSVDSAFRKSGVEWSRYSDDRCSTAVVMI